MRLLRTSKVVRCVVGLCVAGLFLPAICEAEPHSDVDDLARLVLSAGGVHQAGNTQVLSANAGVELQLVEGPYWLEITGGWIYSENIKDGDTVAHNVIARARNELFFTSHSTLWALGGIRWDRFAGLAPSLNAAGGLGIHFIRWFDDDDNMLHRFWFEGGFDLTGNWYDYSITGGTGPDFELLKSIRLFLAWQKVINEDLTIRTFGEALINVEDTNDSRYIGEVAMSTGVGGDFALELLFRILVDGMPQGNAEPVDTITQVNLSYSMQ